MSSKVKHSKTYVVHHRGRSAARGCVIFGRYRVGARSEREAMVLLRRVVGKHSKVNVYFEVREELWCGDTGLLGGSDTGGGTFF